MPLKNGELTTAEIRTLVKAHNKLTNINIPKGAKRADILKIIDDKGYKVDHVGKSLKPKPNTEKTIKKKTIPLVTAKAVTAPKKKSAEQVQKAEEKKKVKAEEKKKSEKIIKKEAVKEFKQAKKSAQKAPKKNVAPKKYKIDKSKQPKTTPSKVSIKIKPSLNTKKIVKKEVKKPIRKVLKPTQKPTGSAVVQPGKPEDLKIEPKKKKVIKFTKKQEALRQKIIASNKKKEEEKKKEAPPIKEKIETPEEMFFRNLNFIEGQYLKSPGESGYVDVNDSSRKKILRVLESIINKKKTSKFTKPEKEVLERVFKFYKSTRAPGQSKKDIENFELFLNKKEEPKAEKKKEAPKKSLPLKIDSSLEQVLNDALVSIQTDVEAIQASQLEEMSKEEAKKSKLQLRILTRLIDTRKVKGFTPAEKEQIENALDRYLELDLEEVPELAEKAKQLQKIIFKSKN